MLPGHVISRFGNVLWYSCSPDLSTRDFVLWGYVKFRAYKNKPRTIQELRWSISREIEALPIEMLKKAMESFEERLQLQYIFGKNNVT